MFVGLVWDLDDLTAWRFAVRGFWTLVDFDFRNVAHACKPTDKATPYLRWIHPSSLTTNRQLVHPRVDEAMQGIAWQGMAWVQFVIEVTMVKNKSTRAVNRTEVYHVGFFGLQAVHSHRHRRARTLIFE